MQRNDTIIISYQAAPPLSTLLLASHAGNEALAREAAKQLLEVDPAAATLAPIILAPYAKRLEIIVPWLEDMIVYTPLVTAPKPYRLSEILKEACRAQACITIVTRSGTRGVEAATGITIITRLPQDCVELRIVERMHTKLYRAYIGSLVIEVLTTANLTAQEVGKTRTGENETLVRIEKVN